VPLIWLPLGVGAGKVLGAGERLGVGDGVVVGSGSGVGYVGLLVIALSHPVVPLV
jgi:hypothetical protein